jgi:transposase
MAAHKAHATRADRDKIEAKVLTLLRKNMSVAEIAAKLDISTSFVYKIRRTYAKV